jgi:hypothetical protein
MTHRVSLISAVFFLLSLSSGSGCSLVSDLEGYKFSKTEDDGDARIGEENEGGIDDLDGGRTDAAGGGRTDGGDSGTPRQCISPDDCESGYCVDGYCCDRRCAGGCESCSIREKEGTCTPVPRGKDPNGFCPPGIGDNAPCIPGGCNGENGCLVAPPTQECRPPSCSNGVAVNREFCRDNGVCPPITETECFPFACGEDACHSSCENTDECHPAYYCDRDSNDCVEKEDAGDGCDGQEQCAEGLTCLDGVCCNQDECPECRNCGDDGECSVVVEDEKDESGNQCDDDFICDEAGDCRRDLGVECSGADECANDICLDGVCCSVSECDRCMNCGESGECDVEVTGRDDLSGLPCAAAETCNDASACIPRWQLVGEAEVTAVFYPGYVTAAGMTILFSTAGNDSPDDYVKLFDTENAFFSDAPLAGTPAGSLNPQDPFCWCGYNGTLVSHDTAFFYFANHASYFKPGYDAWEYITDYFSVDDGRRAGEAATAVLGDHIYRIGGRDNNTLTQYYDTGPGTFVTTGLADHPVGINYACAGASDDKVYVLSYLESGAARMTEYTESTNTWEILPTDDNAPSACVGRNLPKWREFLLHSLTLSVPLPDDGYEIIHELRSFNLETRLWEPDPIAVPDPQLTEWAPAVTSDGVLYAIGYGESEDETVKTVYVYQWVLD